MILRKNILIKAACILLVAVLLFLAAAQRETITVDVGHSLSQQDGPYILSSKVTLRVSSNGGHIYNGDTNWYSEKTTKVYPGISYDLTAVSRNGAQFIHWVNGNNRVVSTDPHYSFTVGTNTDLKAVFASVYEGQKFVVFKSANGTVLQAGYIAIGSDAKAPRDKDIYTESGYVFSGWDKPLTNITENTVITAVYKRESSDYHVSVTGGTIAPSASGNNYEYGTVVTVTLDGSSVPSGKTFSGWSVDGGESIISYSDTYSFCVGADVNVVAVYSDKTVNAVPTIAITDVQRLPQDGRISFLSERQVPEGYTFVEAGILFTKIDSYGNETSLQLQNIDSSTVQRGMTTSHYANGQYKLSVITNSSVTVYARAYLIYIDEATSLAETVYTSVYSQKM